jgi:hypothetical protein
MTPVTITPRDGGHLMTAASADTAGLANYTIKRDFRRELDGEVLSEGFEWFSPNPSKFGHPAANGEPITLIAMARRNNRQTAVVVGTPTTLFRYYGLDNGRYVEDGYIDDTYFDMNDGAWLKIGGGFAVDAQRWQAVSINGWLVLNNGVDLPVTYRLEHSKVEPIYELRELGIASVGCISEHNGILLCGNIRQIKAEAHAALMAPVESEVEAGLAGSPKQAGLARINDNTLTCDTPLTVQPGDTIRMANGVTRAIVALPTAQTATLAGVPVTVEPMQPFYKVSATGRELNQKAGDMFPQFHHYQLVGKNLYWESGEIRRIAAVALDGTITVDYDLPIPTGPVFIENPKAYAAFTDKTKLETFPWRKMWSMPSLPRRFGAIIPGKLPPGSNTVLLDYPAKSMELGREYMLVGAGEAGGNATLKLVALSGRQARFEGRTLSQVVRDADNDGVQETVDVMLTAADAEASITGLFEDLIGDGSAILAMLSLRTLLAIYKESSIVLAQYTGNVSTPWVYEPPIVLPEGTGLGYPHTLINVMESHYYVAQNKIFYSFDLTNRFPQEVGALKVCRDVFSGALPEYVLGKELRPADVFTTASMEIEGLDPNGRFLYVNDAFGIRQEVKPQAVGADGYGVFVVLGQPPEPALFSFRQIFDVRQFVFSAHNPLTKEVWFCFPSITEDAMLRLVYETNSVSTSSLQVTAAAAVIKPSNSPWREDWFAMGSSTGEVMRYGLVAGEPHSSGGVTASKPANSAVVTASGAVFSTSTIGRSLQFEDGTVVAVTGFIDARRVTVLGGVEEIPAQTFTILPGIYHRAGNGYRGVLQYGADAFGVPEDLKTLDQYTLFLADDSPVAHIEVFLRGGVNPRRVKDVLNAPLVKPQDENLLPVWMEDYYLGDRIEVSGMNHLVKVTARVFGIRGSRGRGWSRRPK